MDKREFSVAEAVCAVGVQSHVLRYWEEELQLNIKRSKQGHRIYSASDIDLFKQVKKLKEQGLQLKAIRAVLVWEENGNIFCGNGQQNEVCQDDMNSGRILVENFGKKTELESEEPGAVQPDIKQSGRGQPDADRSGADQPEKNQSQVQQDFGRGEESDREVPEYEVILNEPTDHMLQFEEILKRLIAEVMEEKNQQLEHAITEVIKEEAADLFFLYQNAMQEAAAARETNHSLVDVIRQCLHRIRLH